MATELIKRFASRFVVVALAAALFWLSLTDELSADDTRGLSSTYAFKVSELRGADSGGALQPIRQLPESLQRIDAWISSVGAAVALGDLTGNGRPSDICLVDPRLNTVTLMPAPGTGQERFVPIGLPLPLDERYRRGTVAPMGCLIADVNEDGYADVVVYYWGRTPVLFINSGVSGVLAFRPVHDAFGDERWFTNAALVADVDGDGHLDLVFGNYFQDGARILDVNADAGGEMQHSMSRAYNGGSNRLYLWKSATSTSVEFVDSSAAFSAAMSRGWTLALGAADLNDDLLPEIYVANDFGPDRLLLNRSTVGNPRFELVEGRRGFLTPRSKVLGRDSFKGMGVDFSDVDGDGRLDIAVSNIAEEYALLESHFLFVHNGDSKAWGQGHAPYVDRSWQLGTWKSAWGWDVKFADLSNSGRPALMQAIGFVKGRINRWPELQELAMGNDELLKDPGVWPRLTSGDDLSGQGHDRLFVRDGKGRYRDIWPMLGLGTGTVSRGIALGDVCGDGRLSAAIARQWMPSVFLRNLSPAAGEALVLDLRVQGAISGSRAAVGASVTVVLPDGTRRVAQVDGGSGHSGKRAPEVHIGLGAMTKDAPLGVEVSWRDRNGMHSRSFKLRSGRYSIDLTTGQVRDTSATCGTDEIA